jgi:hypothetical protein
VSSMSSKVEGRATPSSNAERNRGDAEAFTHLKFMSRGRTAAHSKRQYFVRRSFEDR